MIPYLSGATRMPMLPGFSFQVFLAGVPLAFQKISSMTESIQTEQLAEGGRNHYVHSLRSPVTAEKTITFEQGIPVGNIGIETANIALSSQLFKVGNRFPFALVLVCDRKVTRVSRAYLVVGMVLKAWSLSELDATRSDYVIERLEFAYEKLERHAIDAPFLVGGIASGISEQAGIMAENRIQEANDAARELEEAERRKAEEEKKAQEEIKRKANQKEVDALYKAEAERIQKEEERNETEKEKSKENAKNVEKLRKEEAERVEAEEKRRDEQAAKQEEQ